MAGIGLAKPKQLSPSMKPNPGHPLSQKLHFFVAPGASRVRPGGSGLTFGGGPRGPVISSTGSSCLGVEIPLLGTMDEWTMHSICRISSSDIYAPVFCIPASPQNSSWVSPYHAATVGREFNSDDTFLGVNNSGFYNSTVMGGTVPWTDNNWHAWTGQWGRTGGEIFMDGVSVGSTATTSNAGNQSTPTINGTPEVVFCGRSVSAPTAEYYVGQGQLLAMWLRKLSLPEIQMLVADPFCMFGG